MNFFSKKKDESGRNIQKRGTNYKKDKKYNNRKYMMYVSEFLKQDDIDMYEFMIMVNFHKTRGTLVELGKFHNVLKKIIKNIPKTASDEFVSLCGDIFGNIYGVLETPLNNEIIHNTSDIHCKKIKKQMITQWTNITFTKEQKKAIKRIIIFLCDRDQLTYGLYGYAGTGKTTTIVEFISFLIKNKYIRSICLTAPTNKAVNVMKSKFGKCIKEFDTNTKNNFNGKLEEINKAKHTRIEFCTIHKLLNYMNEYDSDGNKEFIKGSKSNIMKYDLVIIDECSMIPLKIISDIFEELQKIMKSQGSNKEYQNIPKILFVGDPAQLPPVNEIKSIIFSKKNRDFVLSEFKRHVSNAEKTLKLLSEYILKQNNYTLKSIVRTKNDNIMGLCNNVRDWVNGKIDIPTVFKFCGKGVFTYDLKKREKKRDTKWLKKYIKKCKEQDTKGGNNIILTWTNRQTNEYNTVVRQKLLNKEHLDQFEIGDILIFKDFYNFDEYSINNKNPNKNGQTTCFYTSEQIKVTDIDLTVHACQGFEQKYPSKAIRVKNSRHIEALYIELIKTLNNRTKRKYKTCKLSVHRLAEVNIDIIPETNILYVIEENSSNDYKDDIEYVSNKIKGFRLACVKFYKEQIKQIDNYLIKPLWKSFNKIFIDPFAEVSPGISQTIHKSQGSTFYNVFVDVNDLLKNNNLEETKRCMYTAFTRASNELHLLI